MEPTRSKQLWLLPLLLALVLGGVFAVRELQPAVTQIESLAAASGEIGNKKRVELTIDTGNGAPRVASVPWRSGLTVQEVLAATGELVFSVQDQGATAFLTELAGQPNEGRGGRNWQFEVNGQWSDRSFGVYELLPNDRILWEFKESE